MPVVRSAKAPGQNSIGTGGQYSLGRNIRAPLLLGPVHLDGELEVIRSVSARYVSSDALGVLPLIIALLILRKRRLIHDRL